MSRNFLQRVNELRQGRQIVSAVSARSGRAVNDPGFNLVATTQALKGAFRSSSDLTDSQSDTAY
jgi:hypothetical protein